MALNSSGPISLAGTTAGQSIEIENGGNGTTQISLNDTAVRNLAGVPSGQIVMPTNFYGKSNRAVISYTYSANTANASLNVASLGGYVAGKSDITITVNSGVYIYSTSTATPGLTLTGGSTGDTITLVNNGYIMGMGGAGGNAPNAGSNGGIALSLGFNTTVNNTNASAYIGGGGGGGGGGINNALGATYAGGGGGAGGAAGGNSSGAGGNGGAGGSIGSSGSNAQTSGGQNGSYGGGGGGRIFPGTGGAGGAANYGSGGGSGGGGGGGGYGDKLGFFGVGGGGGGGWGASGGAGTYDSSRTGNTGGNGGSANAAGSNAGSPSISGGAGGKAVALNGKTVTWVSGNTTRVYGSVA